MMDRRSFLTTAALGFFGARRTAQAQQASKIPRIGYLGGSSPSVAARWQDAFRQGLRDHGYTEGQNIVVEWRSAEGRPERIPDLAAELVQLKVDAIVTSGDDATGVVRRLTATIPIVMATSGDPVASGYVTSLGRPGGNITGLSGQLRELPAKRVELIKAALPRLVRLGHLTRPDPNIADPTLGDAEINAAARALGLFRVPFPVQHTDDLAAAFGAMARDGVHAVMIATQSFTFLHRQRIAQLALNHKLPTIGGFGELPAAGGLMSYGVDSPDLWRRAAGYVDRILKGTNPADLPVEQPTKFELVINLKTAKALGLTIPPSLLLRADQIIE